jgi:hypothetical protein
VHWGVRDAALLLPLASSAPNCLLQCRFRSSFASLAPIFTDKFSFALHTYFSGSSVLRYHEQLTVLHPTTLWSRTLWSRCARHHRPRHYSIQTVKMRAARYYGKEDVRIEHDVPAPPEQLMEGQVRVQPAFVGICGTGMRCSSPSNTTTNEH